jgi:hypothetical protein
MSTNERVVTTLEVGAREITAPSNHYEHDYTDFQQLRRSGVE